MYFASKWSFDCYLRESHGRLFLTAHRWVSEWVRGEVEAWENVSLASCPAYVVYDVTERVFIGCGGLWYARFRRENMDGVGEYMIDPLSLSILNSKWRRLLHRTHLAITKASCPTYVVYDVRTRVFIGCGALCYLLCFFRMASLFIDLNWFLITFIIQLTYILTYIKYFSPFLYNDNIKRKK